MGRKLICLILVCSQFYVGVLQAVGQPDGWRITLEDGATLHSSGIRLRVFQKASGARREVFEKLLETQHGLFTPSKVGGSQGGRVKVEFSSSPRFVRIFTPDEDRENKFSLSVRSNGDVICGAMRLKERLTLETPWGVELCHSVQGPELGITCKNLTNYKKVDVDCLTLETHGKGGVCNAPEGTLRVKGHVHIHGLFDNQGRVIFEEGSVLDLNGHNLMNRDVRQDLKKEFHTQMTGEGLVLLNVGRLDNQAEIRCPGESGRLFISCQELSNQREIWSGGVLEIKAKQKIQNQGEVWAQNWGRLVTQSLINEGDLSSPGLFKIERGACFENKASGVLESLFVKIQAQEVENEGHLVADFLLLNSDSTKNEAQIEVRQRGKIHVKEELCNEPSAQMVVQDRLQISGGRLCNEAGGRIEASSVHFHLKELQNKGDLVAPQGGTLRVLRMDTMGQSAFLSGGLATGSWVEDDCWTHDQIPLKIQTKELHNRGVWQVSNPLTLAIKKHLENADDGKIQVQNGLCLKGEGGFDNKGYLEVAQEARLTLSRIKNAGQIQGRSLFLTTAESLENSGRIQSLTQVDLVGDSRLTNTGDLLVGTNLSATLQSVDNEGRLVSGKSLTLQAQERVTNTGEMGGQQVTLTTPHWDNQNKLVAEDTLSLTADQGHNAGQIQGQSLSVQTTQALENSGKMWARTQMDLGGNARLTNRGDLVAGANLTTTLQSVDNEGRLVSGESLSLRASQWVMNRGNMVGAGATLQAPQLGNAGLIGTQEGDLVLSVKTGQNAGSLQATGDLKLTESGGFCNGPEGCVISHGILKTAPTVTLTNQGLLSGAEGLEIGQEAFSNEGHVETGGNLQLDRCQTLKNGLGSRLRCPGGAISSPALESISNQGFILTQEDLHWDHLKTCDNSGNIETERALQLKTENLKNTNRMVGFQGVQVASACGLLNNSGQILSSGVTQIQASGIEGSGLIQGNSGVRLAASSSLSIPGEAQVHSPEGDVTLQAQSALVQGEVAGKEIKIQSDTGPFTLTDHVVAQGTVSLQAPRGWALANGHFPGDLEVNGPSSGSQGVNVGGNLTWYSPGSLTTRLPLVVGGDLSLHVGGSWANNSCVQVGGSSQIYTSAFQNQGAVLLQGWGRLSCGSGFNNYSQLEARGACTIQGAYIGNYSGARLSHAYGTLSLQASREVSNTSAFIESRGHLEISAPLILNTLPQVSGTQAGQKHFSQEEQDEHNRTKGVSDNFQFLAASVPAIEKVYPSGGGAFLTANSASFSGGLLQNVGSTITTRGNTLMRVSRVESEDLEYKRTYTRPVAKQYTQTQEGASKLFFLIPVVNIVMHMAGAFDDKHTLYRTTEEQTFEEVYKVIPSRIVSGGNCTIVADSIRIGSAAPPPSRAKRRITYSPITLTENDRSLEGACRWQDLGCFSGIRAGGHLSLQARQIENIGATFAGGKSLALQAQTLRAQPQVTRQETQEGYRDVLGARPTFESTQGSVHLEATDHMILGCTQVQAATDLSCVASTLVLEAVKEEFKESTDVPSFQERRGVQHHKTRLEAAQDIHFQTAGDFKVRGADVTAGGHIQAAAGGKLIQATPQNILYTRTAHQAQGSFWSLGQTSRQIREAAATQLERNRWTAGGDIHFQAQGRLSLEAPDLTSGGLTHLQAPKVDLRAVKSVGQRREQTASQSWVWQSQRDRGEREEKCELPHLENQGLVLTAEQVHAPVPPDGLDEAPLWLQQLRSRENVAWESLELQSQGWDHQAQGLSPGAAAVLKAAVAIATKGLGSSLLPASAGAVLAAMADGGVSSLCSQTAVALVNHQGDVLETLRDLGSQKAILQLCTEVASAGAVSSLSQALELPLRPQGLEQHLAQNLVQQGVSGAAALFTGQEPGAALQSFVTGTLAGTLGGVGANFLGKVRGTGDLDPIGHKLLHGALGAATGALRNLEDPVREVVGGALGGAVAETVACTLDTDPQQAAAIAKVTAGTAALLTGQEVETALGAADQALEHNFLGANTLLNLILDQKQIYEAWVEEGIWGAARQITVTTAEGLAYDLMPGAGDAALARKAGWKLAQVIVGSRSHRVLVRKAAPKALPQPAPLPQLTYQPASKPPSVPSLLQQAERGGKGPLSTHPQRHPDWNLLPLDRGLKIHEKFKSDLHPNFPVIDRRPDAQGIVTSLKSRDVHARTYLNPRRLQSRVQRDVDKVAKFKGGKVGKNVVYPWEIKGRALEVIMPHRGNPEQQKALHQAVEYGKSKGVIVKFLVH